MFVSREPDGKAIDFDTNRSRRVRHRNEMARLRRGMEALILSHRGVSGIGGNEEVEDLGFELGFERHDFAVFDVRIRARRATLVCVPSRLWHDGNSMRLFFELKHAAGALGHSVILVPQAFVQRQPRLDNATLLQGAASYQINPTDRMAVLACLIENGSSTLGELACLVRHEEPVSAILYLVTSGALELDLNTSILPVSTIRLASPVS